MMAEIKPIRTSEDLDDALKEIDRLWGAPVGTSDGDRLDVLATLVDAYEREAVPFLPPDPIDAILFRMAQEGISRKQLEPILGGRGRVSEILNRRRGLSLAMIRGINHELGIPLEVLIQESPAKLAS